MHFSEDYTRRLLLCLNFPCKFQIVSSYLKCSKGLEVVSTAFIYIYIASTERRGRAEIDTEAFVWGFRIAAPRAQIWAATPKMLRTKGKKKVL